MELQAVILAAGHGTRMSDLTTDTPKALLPVANMPMIWYSLKMLEKAGFEDVTIVAQEGTQSDISKTVLEIHSIKLNLDFVCVPADDDFGTAESLLLMKNQNKIKSDLLIISCDLISTVPLHRFIDVHRKTDSTLTMLLAPQMSLSEASAPGDKSFKKLDYDIIGLDEKNRVIIFGEEADFSKGTITLKKSVLRNHPSIQLNRCLMDAHLYAMKKWVVDVIASEREIETIKGELVPFLVKKQFSQDQLAEIPQKDEMLSMINEFSAYRIMDSKQVNDIKCHAYVYNDGFCLRSNSIVTYTEANKQVPKQLNLFSEDENDTALVPSCVKSNKSQIGPDCMVGKSTSIDEKSSLKKSVVGSHCKIGKFVKITNSIIMHHVTIEDGCTVSGSIICENSRLSAKCELKDCIVGHGNCIDELGKHTLEVLVK